MLRLRVNGEAEPALWLDEVVDGELGYEGEQEAVVSLRVALSGVAADNATATVVVHEQQQQMKNGDMLRFQVHLSLGGASGSSAAPANAPQSLAQSAPLGDVQVEFSATASALAAKKQQGKFLEDFGEIEESLFGDGDGDGFAGGANGAKEGAKGDPKGDAKGDQGDQGSSKETSTIASATHKTALRPCLSMSVHYVRPTLDKDHALCQLDLAALYEPVEMQHLSIKLPQGRATPLVPATLPLTIAARGLWASTFLLESLIGSMRMLRLSLEYQCGAHRLRSEWSTQVNFAEAQGPLPKTPSMAQQQPSALSRCSVPSVASFSSQAAYYPGSLGGTSTVGPLGPLAAPGTPNVRSLSGISITLAGPSSVKVGAEFEWKVSVINKSNRTRKLVLRFFGRDQAPVALARHEERALVSDPFTLRKRIQAYRTAIGAPLGIIPLVSDLKVGQLGGYACFETTVKLLAAEPGLHSVSGSSVTDVNTGETFDTSELLQVLVVPEGGDGH